MHPMLNIAVKAARRAGSIIMRASDNLDALTVRHKSLNDLVSEVDRAAEEAIIDTLKSAYPDHAILAEESGASGDSEYTWIIDPLDGTTNFLHGFPVYCVSIALAQKGVLTHGVVFDPNRNDLYTASRGAGAFLNDRRIRVSKRDRLIDGLVATGFPFRMFKHTDAYVGMMKEFMQKTAGIRRPGAAALDLASVAAGRMDGFWEIGLSPWDMAAGALLVQEAGGLVGDLEGNEGYLAGGNIVAANPKLFPQMLDVIQRHLTTDLRARPGGTTG
ncbi:MAG: inositol monophosphatase [Betaproteobacteria bacterium]|nr:inositol monophosphatase [Betaproteobacteria bacterium]